MPRKPIIAGNWKMHLNHLEAIALVQKLHYLLRDQHHEAVEVVVHPPFTALRAVQTTLDGESSRILLGAQNCHWENEGAFTGEVSCAMLARLKCSYVIVGHSERRAMFGETDEVVSRKARAVFAAGMTPIVCVGETLEQRDAGEADAVVSGQIKGSLAGFTADELERLVVAYEPVWAIGTGRTASPEDADETCGVARQAVAALGGDPSTARVQYGGSVKPGNIKDLMAKPNIDGALVGGASLDAEDFALIVRYGD